MKKRTVQQLLATIAGAALGGLAVFGILARVGSSPPESPSPTSPARPVSATSPENPQTSSPSPSVTATPSPSAVSHTENLRVESLHVQMPLPAGYRTAQALNLFEASTAAGQPFTMTRASEAQEQEYIALVKSLRESAAATEAPTFAPGRTITLQETSGESGEQSDARLARARETITTKQGLRGTRYRRVEGLQTYDSTYLSLPAGRRIAIHMTYSSEEPFFDEEGYSAVLDGMQSL